MYAPARLKAPAILPAHPRHAATLVAWRHGRDGVEILMGRRAARHRFVPHHYVFPGGRVDAVDYNAPATSELRDVVKIALEESCKPGLARALAIASVRETWEETGLALGELRGEALYPSLESLDYILRAITPPASPIRFHARFFSVEGNRLSGTLRGNGELLDLGWRPIPECLKLPIVDVTEYLLKRIASGALSVEGKVPLFSFRRGRARLS